MVNAKNIPLPYYVDQPPILKVLFRRVMAVISGSYDQRFIFNLAGGYKFNDKWEAAGNTVFAGIPYTPVYRPARTR
jgi:hypothetical protein